MKITFNTDRDRKFDLVEIMGNILEYEFSEDNAYIHPSSIETILGRSEDHEFYYLPDGLEAEMILEDKNE